MHNGLLIIMEYPRVSVKVPSHISKIIQIHVMSRELSELGAKKRSAPKRSMSVSKEHGCA